MRFFTLSAYSPMDFIRAMIRPEINFLKGGIGSADGAAPSRRNIMVQGASSDQGFHGGSSSPKRSVPFGSPVRMKLQK